MYLNAFKVSYMIKIKAQIHRIVLALIRSFSNRLTIPLKYTKYYTEEAEPKKFTMPKLL